MMTISLFYCSEKVFTLINIWMVGKNLMKHHYPKKKIFISSMEDITDADYTHGKRAYKDFKIRNLGDYHNLYLQSNTLLLADVFENF